MNWNFGDLLEASERAVAASAVGPDQPALLHGDRSISWGEFSRRSNNLAAQLQARGAEPDDKVAFYTRNRPEYLEALAACFKTGLVHVNVNYRYLDEELLHILENSDARFVLFAGEFGERVAKLRDRVPEVKAWLQLEDGSPTLDFAERYEELAHTGTGEPVRAKRTPDDLLLMYTGGTTGMPKGVMWRHEDLFEALGRGGNALNRNFRPESLPEHEEAIRNREGPGVVMLPACPLMHGTGLFTGMSTLLTGGTVLTLTAPGFDAHELWRAVEAHGVRHIVIVGDAFAKPMLRALDEAAGRYRIGSLKLIVSSGVMWSPDVKQGLLRHNERLVLVDAFGSSEAIGFGNSVTTKRGTSHKSGKFTIGEKCKVFTEDGREIAPGSEERGYIARSGPIPVGYYKDPRKTAETFKTIDGVRYSIPGDWCRVEEDGTLVLLGRGSVCINTGGEKVYPEEVEQALKAHAAVEDCVVVGLEDEKWGQAVTALVELQAGAQVEEETLRMYVRENLAPYKVPKRVLIMDSVGRAANGKADYAGARKRALEILGPVSSHERR